MEVVAWMVENDSVPTVWLPISFGGVVLATHSLVTYWGIVWVGGRGWGWVSVQLFLWGVGPASQSINAKMIYTLFVSLPQLFRIQFHTVLLILVRDALLGTLLHQLFCPARYCSGSA